MAGLSRVQSCATLLFGLSLLAALQLGCATPAVHSKWKALDAVETVSFAAEDNRPEQETLYWRVESRGLPDRRGEYDIAAHTSDCDHLEFWLGNRAVGSASQPNWSGVDISSVIASSLIPRPTVMSEDCRVEIRPQSWSEKSAPSFEILFQGKSLDVIETHPPRRLAWTVMYPFAAIADTVLAVPIVLVKVIPFLLSKSDDFSWTPGREPNWHREKSERKREEREKEERTKE